MKTHNANCIKHWLWKKSGIWENNINSHKYYIFIWEKLNYTFSCFEMKHFDLWARPKAFEERFCFKLYLTKVLWYFMEAVIWIFIISRRQKLLPPGLWHSCFFFFSSISNSKCWKIPTAGQLSGGLCVIVLLLPAERNLCSARNDVLMLSLYLVTGSVCIYWKMHLLSLCFSFHLRRGKTNWTEDSFLHNFPGWVCGGKISDLLFNFQF